MPQPTPQNTTLISGVAIPASGNTVVFDWAADDMGSLRITIKNTGGAALDVAALQGSHNDTNWIAIDATAFTTAFGSLGAGAFASILESNLYWPYLRLILSAGSGGTTVDVAVTVVRTDTI